MREYKLAMQEEKCRCRYCKYLWDLYNKKKSRSRRQKEDIMKLLIIRHGDPD